MRRRAVVLVLAAAATCALSSPERAWQAPAPSDEGRAGWRRMQEQATRFQRQAFVLLRPESATTPSPLKGNSTRSMGSGTAGESDDAERLRAAALELRDQLEAMESSNERALPEIRLEVSKLETAVVQAQARAAHADEAQEGTRRWLHAVVSSYARRASRDRRLLLRLGRALAAVARSRVHSRVRARARKRARAPF